MNMKGIKKRSGLGIKANRQKFQSLMPEKKNVFSVVEHNIPSVKNYSEIIIRRNNQKPVIIYTAKITQIFKECNK